MQSSSDTPERGKDPQDRPPRSHDLATATYAQIRGAMIDTVVLPLGATEPHNLHLPYATDTLEADAIGDAVCRRATALGAKVVLLPTIPYGTETNMRFLPLAMNLNPSTLFAVVSDLVESVSRSGIRKMLILNSHGGNELKPMVRELAGKTDVHLFTCDWFRMIKEAYSEIFDCPEDHAGEMETSIILARHPELVARSLSGDLLADAGRVRPSRFEAVNRGWVSISRRWDLLTTNTGSGNPHKATAEKGEKAIDWIADRLGQFLYQLGQSDLDDQFPFVKSLDTK
jgi:creatinine amidohydrolase